MRVLLIDQAITGPNKPRRSRWAPLGLAYLAAALRRSGHEVWLHNRFNVRTWDDLSWAEADQVTERLTEQIAPELIGISGVTASFGDALAVAELTRRVSPNAMIVLGGPHATTVPMETLERITAADCLVMGEGEERIVQLAAGMPPDELNGVVWRDDGELRRNPWTAPEAPIDDIPIPARDLLDMRHLLRDSPWAVRGSHLRCTNLLSSRGCLHRCAFCSEPAYSIRGHRAHSPEYTIAEAKRLVADYRVPMLVFTDEAFTAKRDRVMRLMDLWQREGLSRRVRFAVQARADGLDAEMLAAMKQAGCLHIEMGMESGSDRVLKLMNKGCTVAQNLAAAEMVQSAGIMLQLNVICGVPGETEAELRTSLELVESLGPEAASILPFMLFPGTAFARQLIAAGRVPADFWDIRDRDVPLPAPNLSAMDDDLFAELYAEGRALAGRINSATRIAGRPLWYRVARRAKHALLGRPGSDGQQERRHGPS